MSNTGRVEQLTETVGSISIDPNQEVRPGCLGRLSGIIADFKSPTRNGRLYPKKLWVNVFENTPWVKEALETKTLFGEADHPEDRLQSHITEAAVVLTDYSIDDDRGVVTGSFDILDTPNGRILKALANYGSTLGVSTRGQGTTYQDGSTEVVNPEDYIFAGVDVVILPAVKSARQNYVNESLKTDVSKSAKETILNEVQKADTISQLSTLKSIVKSSRLDENIQSSVFSEIDDKTKLLTSSSTTAASSMKDLEEAYSQVSSLKNEVKDLKANTISLEKFKTLSDRLSKSNHNHHELKEEITRLTNHNEKQENLINALKEESDRQSNLVLKFRSTDSELSETKLKLENLYDSLTRKNQRELRLKESSKSLREEASDLRHNLTASDSDRSALLKKNASLSRRLNSYAKQNEDLINKNSELSDNLEEATSLATDYQSTLKELRSNFQKKLSEKKAIKESSHRQLVQKKDSVSDNLLEGYIKLKLDKSGLPYEENKSAFTSVTSKEDVDNVIDVLEESAARLNSLPVNLDSNAHVSSGSLVESRSNFASHSSNPDDDFNPDLLKAIQQANPNAN